MKRTIRLTESDLHRVIEESVRQCLTELDWKTYMSAAEKDSERRHRPTDYDKRSRWKRFRDAAAKAFDEEYGNDMSSVLPDRNGNRFYIDQVTDSHWNKEKNNGIGSALHRYSKHPTDQTRYRHTRYDKYDQDMDMSPEGAETHFPTAKQSLDRMQDEYDAYKNGDYEYDSVKNGGEGKWKRKK